MVNYNNKTKNKLCAMPSARPLIPEPRLAILLGNSPQFTSWVWYSGVWNIPLPVQGTCPSHAPSDFILHTFSLAEHETRKGKSLTLDKYNLVENQNISVKPKCYQYHSCSEAKTLHCISYWEEINSILAETRTYV